MSKIMIILPGFGFDYDTQSGVIHATNNPGMFRTIEHVARHGFEIDWLRSNPHQRYLLVHPPIGMTDEDAATLIKISHEDAGLTLEEIKEKEHEALMAGNVNHRNGKVLNWGTLCNHASEMKNGDKYTRQDVVDYFNSFNLEEARPRTPIVKMSSKPKKSLLEEGTKLMKILFDQGQLSRLTETEVSGKMKYHALQEEQDKMDITKSSD